MRMCTKGGPWRRLWLGLAGCLLLGAATAVLVSLGASSKSARSASARPDLPPGGYLVGASDLRSAGSGTPGAAVLKWWQAIQYGEPALTIRRRYQADRAPSVSSLRSELRLLRYRFRSAKPFVLDQSVDRNDGRVFTSVVTYGNSRELAAATTPGVPVAFTLKRVGFTWLLADDNYLSSETGKELNAAKARAAHRR
jgi:hypothetical protein